MLYNSKENWLECVSMIKKIYVCKANGLDPYRNIATEKYLLEHVQPGACILYLWQNQNTVVIGRNQNAWAECRTSLLEQEGGHLARRLSGGGAVFHDLGNLNFTFLMCEEDYDLDRQLSVISEACKKAGIAVERSGRNDLLAEGQKFSGNAFYHSQGHAYHHGTLLVSADMEKLSRYLTPSKAKLESKGVSSVRSRVVNLIELSPSLTCQLLSDYMEEAFCKVYGLEAEPYLFSQDAQEEIHKASQALCSWQWLYGQKLPFTVSLEDRFSWGSIQLQLQVTSGKIAAIQVYSDSMQWEIAEKVEANLLGLPFSVESVCNALTGDLDPIVAADICQLFTRTEL